MKYFDDYFCEAFMMLEIDDTLFSKVVEALRTIGKILEWETYDNDDTDDVANALTLFIDNGASVNDNEFMNLVTALR